MGIRDGVEQTGNIYIPLIGVSGTASSSGNNDCVTPTSGRRIRLFYVSYNNYGGPVTAAFRFGAGPLFMQNNLVVAGSIVAKDFNAFKVMQGATDEKLILNLSSAVSTLWNAFYEEFI